MRLNPDKLATCTHNLLSFLRQWYFNMVFISQNGHAYRRKHAGIPSGLLNTQYLDSYCNLFVIIHAMCEYGLTDYEIDELSMHVMGDDNVTLTQWSLPKLFDFCDYLVNYAWKRFGMKINPDKIIRTSCRHEIEILSYQVNFGRPRRRPDKLIAQLCLPERGVVDKWMSMRAIGIAYASCGMDHDIYEFCKDVYNTFLPYAEPITSENAQQSLKYLPGMFRMLDSPPEFIYKDHFPSLDEIIAECETWKGPLPNYPKWDSAHFLNNADEDYIQYQTLDDWLSNR